MSSIVHALGVPMGVQWVPMVDASWAPDHFWADAEFADLHNALLANLDDDAKIAYGMSVINPANWTAYRALIASREAANDKWGFKDLWLPILWKDIEPLFSHTIQPIFTARDPDVAAASYQARKAGEIRSVQAAKDRLAPWRNAVATIRAAYPTALEVPFNALVNPATKTGWVTTIAAYVGKPSSQAAVDRIKDDWGRFF